MIRELYPPAPAPAHEEVEEVYDGTRIYDIDANVENPLLCPEIADEVIKNLRLMEVEKRAATTTNVDVATQIDRRSRADHVHWLIDAAQKLNCAPTTLHLAVNYFDRYSSGRNPIEIKDSDMVALTCLMIASKFDGVEYEFCFEAYVGNGLDELVGMEARILSYLEYKLAVPTACSFLERFVAAAQCGRHAPLQGLEGMAAGFAEVSLFSTTVLRSFLPSMVAASSVFLARYVLDPSQKPWNATLRHYTMYEASDLQDCVLALHNKWCTINLEKKEKNDHAARSKLSDDHPVQVSVGPVTRLPTEKLKEVLSELIIEAAQEKELRVRPIQRDEPKKPTKNRNYFRVISRRLTLLLNFRDLDRFILFFLYFLVLAAVFCLI